MSNLTKGKKVRIIATGEIGVIKDIERVKRQTGNYEDVTYLVKRCDKPGWIQCERKSIQLVDEKNKPKSTAYPKYYADSFDLDGERVCTLVAEVTMITGPYIDVKTGERNGNFKTKCLAIAYAVCHPDDEFNPETGLDIAKKRCVERPMALYYTPNTSEFREDMVKAVLEVKKRYIIENSEKFTKQR